MSEHKYISHEGQEWIVSPCEYEDGRPAPTTFIAMSRVDNGGTFSHDTILNRTDVVELLRLLNAVELQHARGQSVTEGLHNKDCNE